MYIPYYFVDKCLLKWLHDMFFDQTPVNHQISLATKTTKWCIIITSSDTGDVYNYSVISHGYVFSLVVAGWPGRESTCTQKIIYLVITNIHLPSVWHLLQCCTFNKQCTSIMSMYNYFYDSIFSQAVLLDSKQVFVCQHWFHTLIDSRGKF